MRQPARRPGNSCPDRHPPQPRRGRAPGAKTDTSYAQSNPKSTSYHHRGKPFGLTKRASRKRPNPLSEPNFSWSASSLCVSYGPCSSVPASGCHHRPVPGCPALKSRRSGTRKTRTKFAFTLSGRSADNLEPQGPPEPSPMPSTFQSPTHRKGADFPMTMTMTMTTAALPPTARPPPAWRAVPARRIPLVTVTAL